MRKLTPGFLYDVHQIERVLGDLRLARVRLRLAGAHTAARSVAKSMKSVEGAIRHAYRRQRATESHLNYCHLSGVICNHNLKETK